MKSLAELWQETADELAVWCRTSTSRDCKTVTARVEHEGESFLTIRLPVFGSDFQKSLDLGRVDRSLFQGYTWRGGLPRFLRGFLGLVFDASTGILLDSPSVDAIFAVRQLTLMFGKLEEPCSDARVSRALAGYVECEQEVRESDSRRTESDLSDFRRMAQMLLAPAVMAAEQAVYDGTVIPKHGPGQTADRKLGNQKYRQTEWTWRLEQFFPSGEFLSPTWEEDLPHVRFLEPGDERPVKVTVVPKTPKSPRIIAMEPTCMMYAQQGLMELIVGGIEKDDLLSHLIGFRDQTVNNRMAMEGSFSGSLATLDLSEASDRVSNQLVRNLFPRMPHLRGAVEACRSRKAEVRGHGVIRLAKYASMGSALCFPIEAMVFTTILCLGIQKQLRRPLTRRDLYALRSKVRVYGDDIIVPVEFVHSVIAELETFGLRVNSDKSFWTGRFRESCGKEYYDGHDVSIVRVRTNLPNSRKNVAEIASTVSTRNQAYQAGLWGLTSTLDSCLRRVIPLPTVSETSRVQGRHSLLGYEIQKTEVGKSMQRPLVRGAVVTARIPVNSIDGPGALLKYFLKRSSLPAADREHLLRSGRPDALTLNIRWASPF